MLPFLVASALLLQAAHAPVPTVTLLRSSKAHEQLAYSVRSHMHTEKRGGVVETWFPQDIDLSYDFTAGVTELKPGGVAVMRYQRPTMTQVLGESLDGPGSTEKVPIDLDFMVTLSPINEILGEKDLAKSSRSIIPGCASPGAQQLGGITQFITEIYMLARNLGNFDSSLDFAPKLPVDDVKSGDTWKHTVGYSPQKVAGQSGKTAVQRLDYTYGYQGVATSDGKQVYRVTADLNLNTNLADFYFQTSGEDQSSSPLKAIPIQLKTHIDFDLDMKTCETLKAVSESTGGFSIVLNENPDQPVLDEKFKATTTMLLKSRR